MRVAINFITFQIGWFAAVLGAGHGVPWLGPVVVPLILLVTMTLAENWKPELIIALCAAVMGFLFDTALVAFGVFQPVPYATAPPLSPLWMVMLWVNQATTLNGCMAWLRGRYVVAALFGALGGPLAYLGGARLGAAALPSSTNLLFLGIAWAIAFPLLVRMADVVYGRFARGCANAVPA